MNGVTSGSRVKPWEHVWTVDEIRRGASSWHLAGDVGVNMHSKCRTYNAMLVLYQYM